jgi:enoyl-CoA hydratase/carnithine racemase
MSCRAYTSICISTPQALELMTSGSNVRAPEALQLGILDDLTPQPFSSHDDVMARATEFILSDR